MGCESHHNSNCVCDVLLAIVEAQEKVSPIVDDDCEFSCEASIQELVGGVVDNTTPYNTIPVLLMCKNTCDIFIGTGARRTTGLGVDIGRAVAFRVVNVDPDTCCAQLELLQFSDPMQTETTDTERARLLDEIESLGLARTHVCITVDLNCFCGVTCLPAAAL